MVDGCNSGHASYYKTIGKSGLFYRGKGELGGAAINKIPLATLGVSSVMAFHWLSCDRLLGWAVPWAGISRVGFFPVRNARCGFLLVLRRCEVWGVICVSSPFWPPNSHFKWGFLYSVSQIPSKHIHIVINMLFPPLFIFTELLLTTPQPNKSPTTRVFIQLESARLSF